MEDLEVLPLPKPPADWNGRDGTHTPIGTYEPFAGTIPEKYNVKWDRPVDAPASVAFGWFTRPKSEGGLLAYYFKGEEGTGVHEYIQNGAIVMFGNNVNYEVVSISKDKPHNFTYRVFSTTIPAFTGLTAAIEWIPDANDPAKCTMVFQGQFDNNVPCGVLSFVTKNVVIGVHAADIEASYKSGEWKKWYKGPPIEGLPATEGTPLTSD